LSRALTAAEQAAADDHEWELDRVAWNLPLERDPVDDTAQEDEAEPSDEATPQAREAREGTDEVG
jgi:hypothetical protein